MKIEDLRDDKIVRFYELGLGDVFVYNSNVYIKTLDPESYNNAVNITNGDISYLDDRDQVIKLESAKLVIGERLAIIDEIKELQK